MSSQLNQTAEALDAILRELEAANLPIAAAHVSTAVELLKSEMRRREPSAPVKLRAI